MAETIDVHPVRFNYEQHCSIEQGFNQIVQCGDITQFQLLLEPCLTDREVVLNGSFTESIPNPWFTTTGWTYDSANGHITHQAGTGIGQLYQLFSVGDGTLVRLTFTIDFLTESGSALLSFGTFIKSYFQSGTYTEYITADSVGALGWVISDDEIRFSFASVQPINTNYGFRVVDRYGTVVGEYNSEDHPTYFTFIDQYATITYNWVDNLGQCLPDGCYFIEVAEPCDCLNGGLVAENFATVQGQWNFSPDDGTWDIYTGSAVYAFPFSSPAQAIIPNAVCGSTSYEVTYTLSNLAVGTFQVRLKATLGVLRDGAVDPDGTSTEIITTTGTSIGNISMIGNSTVTGGITVTNFKVRPVERVYSLRSNPFELVEEAPCSVLISACNDENGLQGGYNGTGFSPSVRLKCTYGQGYYTSDQEHFENSYGNHNRYYYRGHKVKSLRYGCAEYLHDFLAHLGGYDHVYVDGEEVFVYDEEYPKPEYVMNYDYGTVEIGVGKKTELIEKRKCSGIVTTCESNGKGVGLIIDGGSTGSTPSTLAGEKYEIITSG